MISHMRILTSVLIALLFTLITTESFSQSTCQDSKCIFSYSTIPPSQDLIDYSNKNLTPYYFINSPRTGYKTGAFIKMKALNQANGSQDFIKVFIDTNGYWKEIGTIHVCNINHSDRNVYFLNGYNYAYSKGDNKPIKIQLIDNNKRWKVE
jgi:hypothetical protein